MFHSALSECPEPSLIVAYRDGWLPRAVSAHVEAHLDVCEECRATVDDLVAFPNVRVRSAVVIDEGSGWRRFLSSLEEPIY